MGDSTTTFANIEPRDLAISRTTGVAPRVLEILRSENRYRARSWDREVATRYVLGFHEAIAEASFFAHFMGPQHVKNVIELPTSYGCPIGCRHCAATLLKERRQLTESEILGMTEWIAKKHRVTQNDPFLVTFSGIGEGALHRDALAAASRTIHKLFKRARFTFTTVGYDPSFVDFVDKLASQVPVHFLQVSYLHYDTCELTKIVPAAERLGFDFESLLEAVRESAVVRVRLNYVVMRNFNDSADHVMRVIASLSGLERKIVVRIAMLNQTGSSRRYGIRAADIGTLADIEREFLDHAIDAYIFASSRDDNMNCGQLAGRYDARMLRE